MSSFTAKEKKDFLMKKYIKEHIFDFVLEIIVNVLFVWLILNLCGGSNYPLGIGLAVVYSLVKIINELYLYRKEWLNRDAKEEKEKKEIEDTKE